MQVQIASFLPTKDSMNLSLVNHTTYRRFTSQDADQTYWKYRMNPSVSLHSLLNSVFPFSSTVNNVASQLSTTDVRSSLLVSIDGSYWKIEYIERVVLPNSIPACFHFLHSPLIRLRISALRNLRRNITTSHVQNIFAEPTHVRSLIRCLQYGQGRIAHSQGIPREVVELLYLTCALLVQLVQTNCTVSSIFRQNEGITSVIALLRNEVLNPRSALSQIASEQSPVLSITSLESTPPRSMSSTPISMPMALSTSMSSGTSSYYHVPANGNGGYEMVSARDANVRKVVHYLLGILMNLCKLQTVNCMELVGLQGIEMLLSMIQLTNDKVMVYSLETIKACCKACPEARDRMARSEGVIRVINTFSSPNTQVVISAVELIRVVLNGHAQNTRLFRLASGLHSLTQIEESWTGTCGVQAAKTICNLLNKGRFGIESDTVFIIIIIHIYIHMGMVRNMYNKIR